MSEDAKTKPVWVGDVKSHGNKRDLVTQDGGDVSIGIR